MKFIHMLVATSLFVLETSSFCYVSIVTPDFNDIKNDKTFTIVAKASGYGVGECLTVTVNVVSDITGSQTANVFPEYTVNSDQIEIMMPKPSEVSDTSGKFTIVAKATGWIPGETLKITVSVTNSMGFTSTESTQVSVK